MKEDQYFNNLNDRERAIFEGGISMGALFHQFIGTPVNNETIPILEKAMEESIQLQPAVVEVSVNLDEKLIESCSGTMGYTSLTGEMMHVKIITKINDKIIKTCISYDEDLHYPIMYIED